MTVARGLRAEGRGCEGEKWESRRVCDGSLLKKDSAIGEEERSSSPCRGLSRGRTGGRSSSLEEGRLQKLQS